MTKIGHQSEPAGNSWLMLPLMPEPSEGFEFEKSELFQALFESSGIGKALLDERGRLIDINGSLPSLLGQTQAELQHQAFPGRLMDADAAQLEFFMRQLVCGRLESYATVKPLRHREGQALTAALHLTRLTEPGSRQSRILLEVLDQSRQHQEAAAWRAGYERLKQAESLAQVSYAAVDLQTGQAHWSDEVYPLFGLSKDKFKPQEYKAGIDKLVLPTDTEQVKQGIEGVIGSGQPATIHFRIRRPDGELRLLQARIELFKDLDGQPVRLIFYNIDITPYLQQSPALATGSAQVPLAHMLPPPQNPVAAHGRPVQPDRIAQTVSVEQACQRAMQMLAAEWDRCAPRFSLDFTAWSHLEAEPILLDNLLFQLLHHSLRNLGDRQNCRLRLYSAFDAEARPLLIYEAEHLDLSAYLQHAELKDLSTRLEARGGELVCTREKSHSRCRMRLSAWP